MARRLRTLSLVLDIVAVCGYAFLVLGGRCLLPTPWLQNHLVNVFAGYAWPRAVHDFIGRRLERSLRPGTAPKVRGIVGSSALALAGLALFELGVQSDLTDFLVELPGALLFATVNGALVVAGVGRSATRAPDPDGSSDTAF